MKNELEPQPAAVTVVGGFLGAGKTTLLNRLMKSLEGVPTAVLVNDFGSIVVDAGQVVSVEGGVIQLPNGCICCTIRNDLTSTLLQLLERPDRPRHVFVETSGVADPIAVAQSLLEIQRLGGVRLDGVISVVDAEHFDLSGQHRKLLRAQVRAADVIVLNKTDLVTPARVAELEGTIRALVPSARIYEAVDADVPPHALLGVETDTARLEGVPVLDLHVHDASEGHAHGFATHTFRTSRPLRWTELGPLLKELSPSVFRVKGLINLVERAGDRILLHVVGSRIYVRTIERWGDATPRTELILIGLAGAFDPEALDERLLACAA